jgi:hypothetical protein
MATLTASCVLVRTAAGRHEVAASQRQIDRAARLLMLTADGRRTLEDLAPGFRGGLSAVQALAAQLLSLGLVELRQTAAPAPDCAQTDPRVQRLKELCRSLLGASAATVAGRLDRMTDCSETHLHAAVSDMTRLIRLTIDDKLAAQFATAANDALQPRFADDTEHIELGEH